MPAEVMPWAISPRLRIEHGATIMPMVRNEPLDMAAARSSILWLVLARRRTSATFILVSWARVTSAVRVITRWVSTGRFFSACRSRTP